MITSLTSTGYNLNIVGIGGSTREGSRNGSVLRAAMSTTFELGGNIEIFDLHACQFPMLVSGQHLDSYPNIVKNYVESVSRADGIILATPTYHGSMSGAIKNALDLLFLGSSDYFNGKPVGLITIGGANAQPVLEMMSTIVHSLKGMVVPTRVVVPHGAMSSDGSIVCENTVARIGRMAADLVRIASALRLPSETPFEEVKV